MNETEGVCSHLVAVAQRKRGVRPSAEGCEECLQMGGVWVHLRLCLTCGHVGCCDQSPSRHARRHFHVTTHPVVRSYEPEEPWAYCFHDDMFVEEIHMFDSEAAAVHFEPDPGPSRSRR